MKLQRIVRLRDRSCRLRKTQALLLLLVLISSTTSQLQATGIDSPLLASSPGIVIESFDAESALAYSGILLPGDIVVNWDWVTIPYNFQIADRSINSPFDWLWLETEAAPQGPLQVQIVRAGTTMTVPLHGIWHAKIRPRLDVEHEHLHLQARTLYQIGRLHEAANLWNRLAVEALVHGRIETAIWARIQEYAAWSKPEETAQSREAFDAAILTAADIDQKIYVWAALAASRATLNNLDGAIEAYETISQLTEDYRLMRAWAHGMITRLAWKKGDIPRAHDHSQASAEAYSQLAPESTQLAAALNASAVILDEMAFQAEAEQLHRRSLAVGERIGDESIQLINLNNLGAIAATRGDFVQADFYLGRALTLLLRTKAEQNTRLAILYANLGALNFFRENIEIAKDYYTKSLELIHDEEEPSIASSLLTNLGKTELKRENYSEASKLCDKALEVATTLTEDLLLVGPLNCLSIAKEKSGHLAEATKLAEQALQIAEAHAPASIKHAYSLMRAAEVDSQSGNLKAAEDKIIKALDVYELSAPLSDAHAQALEQLALLYTKTDRGEHATAMFERAIYALESQITKSYDSEADRGHYRSRYSNIYPNYVAHLVLTGESEKAFHILERWRAGEFLSMLAERDLLFAEVPPEIDRERRRVSAEYDRILQQLSMGNSPQRVEHLKDQLSTLRTQHREIERRIRDTAPRLDALRYPQPLNFHGAQKSLEPGTIMVSFAVYPSHTLLFVVTPKGRLKIVQLVLGEDEIRREVESLVQMLSEAPSGLPLLRNQRLRSYCRRLYQLLLKPIDMQIEAATRIVIIPDGPLQILPWGALIRETTESSTSRTQYLAEWRPLHVALSATVYDEIRATRLENRSESGSIAIAAFGDPIYNQAQRLSPESTNIEQTRLHELIRSGLHLQPLPGSRREIEGITALFPGAAKAYLGAEATEERAKSISRRTRVVHFAAHAKIDEESPLDSAVVLTIPEALAEGKENGLLQGWEIFERFRVDADLVVLSACESGLGKVMGGEGLIGLTRAFQYAGARSVMASLWKISDRTTAELMVRFYRHLKEGLSKDEALRATQMEFIRGPIQVTNDKGERVDFDASAPYYWAAFQIYGDWQ